MREPPTVNFVPFELTHVEFIEGDKLGELCALLAQSPIFILVSLTTLFLSRRDLGTAVLIVGLLVSTLLCSTLKGIFKERRPHGERYPSHLVGDEWGMPSNHSQFLAFCATYVSLWCMLGRWMEKRFLARAALTLSSFCFAACVIASRVYLGYHSVHQVLVGAGVGSLLGSLWFSAAEYLFRPYCFRPLLSLTLAKWLRLKDVGEIDVLSVEHEALQLAVAKALKARPSGLPKRSDTPLTPRMMVSTSVPRSPTLRSSSPHRKFSE